MTGILISFEFPPEAGGIGTYCYQILKSAEKNRIELDALVLTYNADKQKIEDFDSSQSFNIIRFKLFKNYVINVIYRIIKTLLVISHKKYDFIFVGNYKAGFLALLCKLIFNLNYVVIGHGTEFLIKNKVLKLFIKTLYKYSSIIFVNSTYTQNIVTNIIRFKNIYNIPLGADNDLYKPINEQSLLSLKDTLKISDNFVLLTVGKLSKRKDHITVCKALNILKTKYKNIKYLIIGSGEFEKILKKEISNLNLEDDVIILGHIPTDKLNEYYNLCDVFILNSLIEDNGQTEGFGIVIIEANLASKPAIGTRGCGIEDAISENENGFLVDMQNPEQTAAAVEKLYLNNSLKLKIGKKARERALKDYTWEKVGLKTFNIIKKNLGQ